MSLLDEEYILEALSGEFNCIEYHQVLDSTNTKARSLAIEQLPALVVCDYQSQGRGRRKNIWLDEEATSLTFSIVFKLSNSFVGLSLAVGIGIVATLRELGYSTKLKWPNDVLGANDKKLAGILIETVNNNKVAICGIGINVFRNEKLLAQVPNSEYLAKQQDNINRNELLIALSKGIKQAIDTWQVEQMNFIQPKWQEYTIHKTGEQLAITNFDGSKQEYIYHGLSDTGELLVKDELNKIINIASAEVNLESISN